MENTMPDTNNHREPFGLRPKAAAEALGVCEATIWNLIKAGKLQSSRIGRARLVHYSSIKKLLEIAA